jgi:ubiquinone/menaquinone biosynthesis C-methylase UbiE
MKAEERKNHWEKIYSTKRFEDVSWYQSIPTTSLQFVKKFNLSKDSKIIDIGGGDSFLVDNLLEFGFENITVLDISENAIRKAKERLGEKAKQVKWIIADAASFKPSEKYDFWHDRAAFHFLTNPKEIKKYVKTIQKNLNQSGYLVIGTFSEDGPEKCSGIEIKQYSENSMSVLFEKFFNKIVCFTQNHSTPFGTIQNFIFCSFKPLSI